MSRTFVQPGDKLTHANSSGSDISAGDVVEIGSMVAIADVDIADGESGTVTIAGVHEVAKTTGTAWSQGDMIDWDTSAGEFHTGLTPATGDITDCGIAAEDAASGDATGRVLLLPGRGTVN